MKINAKLFLLTFAIIATVTVASAFIYNTLSNELIQKQLSKNLVNSANDFIFAYEELNAKLDEEFKLIKKKEKDFNNSSLDFLIQVKNDSLIVPNALLKKSSNNIFIKVNTINEFLLYNNSLLIRKFNEAGKVFYYGIHFSNKIVTQLSEKVRADIALSEDDVITIWNQNKQNATILPYLSRISRELKKKENFEIVQETIDGLDYSATHYSPLNSSLSLNQIDFIIYNISDDAVTFRETMKWVTLIIVVAGLLISVIFQFIFTTKFRNQIEHISKSVKEIAAGNTDKRVKIISNDELGDLGNAFNNMLNEIEKRDTLEKHYSEIVALINKNSSLQNLGYSLLKNLVNNLGLNAGALYLVDNNSLTCFASYGIQNLENKTIPKTNYYKLAEEQNQLIEQTFNDNHPIIKTGITELKINHLFVLPISYNGKLLAIMELASVVLPKFNIREFLGTVKDQIAIGIANGQAFDKLKKLVAELQELNDAYQKQNNEITEKNKELIELHAKLKKKSEELEKQTEKAVESEKIKSQFLANMSHELRTPQNSIIGLTELILKDDHTNDKTKERLNVVLRNSKKLLTLIDNILEYSKLESGSSKIVKSKIKLFDLINEVSSYIEPLFLEREVEFSINIPKTNYDLYTDVNKVEQIICNLVGNAAKFTNSGFVSLDVKLIKNNLEITVLDTGPGISDKDKEIIFDEFRQADGNYNRKFSGTGLGLAICKRYTELLGGSIRVDDNTPVGAKFIVTLNDVVQKKSDATFTFHSETDGSQEIKSLIISDGTDSLKLLQDFLISFNCKVKVETSEQVSLDTILAYMPDIIILDVLLKNEIGWKLLSDIKNSDRLKNIPVTLINLDEDTNCGLGLNVYDYVTTNLDEENVINLLESIEVKQGIQFEKILFLYDKKSFSCFNVRKTGSIVKFLSYDEFKTTEDIKEFDPEIILLDLCNDPLSSMNALCELYDDNYCKSIPTLAFIDGKLSEEEIRKLNNAIFETTLIKQYHPLDVLKFIKEKIELKNNYPVLSRSEKNNSKPIPFSEKNNIKILIVDDNRDARFTIGEIIESLGYQPVFAKDGYECLEKLEEELPELVLLDIMMPRMDGFKTIKKIRENKYTSELKVYALTAYAMLSDKEIIERNGFDGLFTKPINTVQLERKLNNILKSVYS